MDQILTTMAVLIEYPWLAAAIGLMLVSIGQWRGRGTAMGVGFVWLLYACYETAMQQGWLCSGECNIRVDLLLLYPLLLVATLIAIVSLLRTKTLRH